MAARIKFNDPAKEGGDRAGEEEEACWDVDVL